MGSRRLNCNNYVKCSKEEATLEIILFKLKDGTTPPPIYLKSVRKPKPTITLKAIEAGTAEWTPVSQIDIKGSPAEYQKIVNWWFEQAHADDVYRQGIIDSYKNLRNLKEHIQKAKNWLLTKGAYNLDGTGDFADRKKEIDKFLRRWLTKQLKEQK